MHDEVLLYCELLEAGGYEHGDIKMKKGRQFGRYRYIRAFADGKCWSLGNLLSEALYNVRNGRETIYPERNEEYEMYLRYGPAYLF